MSIWISTDPILGDYLPIGDDGDKTLRGMGGVFKPINIALYAYAHHNPILLLDPDGNDVIGPINYNRETGKFENPKYEPATAGEKAAFSATVDFIPVAGDVKGVAEAFTGKDTITGESLSWTDRGLGLVLLSELRGAKKGAKALGRNWGRAETLVDHFKRHGSDFGAKSKEEYADMATSFLERAKKEKLPTKTDKQGTIRVYDPKSNTFGSYNPDGTTKTFFKPTKKDKHWKGQPGSEKMGIE